MTQNTPQLSSGALPHGHWRVVAAHSELAFSCRGMFGLWPVRGIFHRFTGSLDVDDDGVAGQLVVESASVDTRLAFRDRHLRASDFLDVDRHPTFTVTLRSVDAPAEGPPQFSASLAMRSGLTTVTGPLAISRDDGQLVLATALTVPRVAAGLDQRHHGMVARTAYLSADLRLSAMTSITHLATHGVPVIAERR